MDKFGTPFRQAAAFGIGGVLQENAHVYYDTLFSSRHIGRVSDLLASCLKDRGFEEVRFRALILFGFFEAFSTRSQPEGDPIVVECGLDDEKLAVAVGFEADETTLQSISGLPERISQGKGMSRFDEMISDLQFKSHHVLIRYQNSTRRIELIAFLALTEKVTEVQADRKATLQLVEVPAHAEPGVKVARYTELGDLDHSRLLAEDTASKKRSDDDDHTRVSGGPEFLVDAEKVEGSASHETEIRLRMEADEINDQVVKVEGGDGIRGLLKKIWPFRRRAEKFDADEQELLAEINSGSTPESQEPGENADSDENDLGGVAQELEEEIGGNTRFSRKLDVAQRELASMKAEFGSDKARVWADGLMRDVLGEKARLHDLAKRLGATVRQRELSMKTKEKALNLELKQRDELLHQKELALTRARDQISHINLNLEKMKQARGMTEDGRYKQKFSQSQRLLEVAKEENRKLAYKAEELKRNLNAAQIAATRQRGPSTSELLAMKKQQDLAQKQLEEYKKANQLLLEKLNVVNSKRDAKSGADEETRKRLDAAMKMLTAGKQENQQLNLRLQRSEQDRLKLQKQLEDALSRIKAKGRAA